MNPALDYYRILGVLDEAEDIVIKAAYRALIQRYHPDRWTCGSAEANQRTAEILEAYAILSDPIKRKKYDTLRGNRSFEPDPKNGDEGENSGSDIDEKWELACEYFPDLIDIAKDLSRISSSLAFTFKLTVLGTQALNERREISQRLENLYFQKYFGKDEKIILYAKSLLLKGRKAAASELNRAVCVLGTKVDAALFIRKIEEKFPITSVVEPDLAAVKSKLIAIVNQSGFAYAQNLASKYLSLIGGSLESGKRVVPFLGILSAEESVFKVTLYGETKTLNAHEFVDWLKNSAPS